MKVKMETSDDDQLITVIAEGGKEGNDSYDSSKKLIVVYLNKLSYEPDLERFAKTLQLPERGKIYMKGIFEAETMSTEVSDIVKSQLDAATQSGQGFGRVQE